MTKKRFVVLLIAAVIVLIARVYLLSSQGDFTPLTALQKEEILKAYTVSFDYDLEGPYTPRPIRWFDENGGERNPGVYRYFGRYGDNFVLLRYGNGTDIYGWPIEPPFIIGWLSRRVECPVDCEVYICNLNPNRPKANPKPPLDELDDSLWSFCSLRLLHEIDARWLTNSQLRQLTNDLEDWIAAGNY